MPIPWLLLNLAVLVVLLVWWRRYGGPRAKLHAVARRWGVEPMAGESDVDLRARLRVVLSERMKGPRTAKEREQWNTGLDKLAAAMRNAGANR